MKKILCIHGIGGKDAIMDEWSPKWREEIARSCNMEAHQLEFDFLKFDHIFAKYSDKNGIKYVGTIAKLIRDWLTVSIFKEARDLGFREKIRWYAGMVVQFVEDDELRNEMHYLLRDKLKNFEPDIIYTHSLGTLLTYDFLRQEAVKGKSRDLTLVTSGSQIGHPALLKFFGGYIQPLNVKHWYNFYNQNDKVFAYEPIAIDADNFTELETSFSNGLLSDNHEALQYISHDVAIVQGWQAILDLKTSRALTKKTAAKKVKVKKTSAKNISISNTNARVLLVGINDYPDEANQLNGCLNDVFRMSEVLQEAGIAPENIKVVLNERATSKNIRTMMDWLLKDARSGDFRFFYYSGHGAQIPSGGMDGEDDHLNECLVTYDFDWTNENAYTDKEFLAAYSKLDYGVNFITMLDCCHSGGMARDGLFKARGLNAPDDIRHRTIKWDPKRQMWIPRDMELAKRNLFDRRFKAEDKELYVGSKQNLQRFGRGVALWEDYQKFEKAKKTYGTYGPYMPLIIEACRENEYSYEYKHGVTSYGAFTYSVTTILRELNRKNKASKISYYELIEKVKVLLREIGYEQTPQLVGPKFKLNAPVPLLNI